MQSTCLYGREVRHDIYMFTDCLYCNLDLYVTQFVIYSALRSHARKVLVKTWELILTTVDLGSS